MRRVRAGAPLLALAALALAGAADADLRPPVRLDRAGLAALARENPAHYERVRQIRRTRSRVGDAALSAILLTNAPPQQELGFVLDDVPYVMRVTPRAAPWQGPELVGSPAPAAACPVRPK